MNRRVFIFVFTLLFIACPIMILAISYAFLKSTSSFADIFIYTSLTAVLYSLILVAQQPDFQRFVSLKALALKLGKIATVSIGITVLIICISYESWGVSLYLPFLHWAGLLILAGVVILSTYTFQKGNAAYLQKHILSGQENILIVGTTDLARNYIQWIEDAGAEYITLAGILEENMSFRGRTFLSSRVLGQPVEISKILKQLKAAGSPIDRLVITCRFEELSHKTQGMLTYHESEGALMIDRMGDRVTGNDNTSHRCPIIPSARLTDKRIAKISYHYETFQSHLGAMYEKHKSLNEDVFRQGGWIIV